ncbi:hypothetical protein [Paenibacillus lentus]|uniref:DUF3955 domain-containing protein n=1 Tax=Paenibacillus lentus TaxID=1338368 RepID=A0A3Q8S3L1_9BACL|nr:hypothetical protein [Paenibacillus lentus]AZK45136.1 hypothetical protein EIM92_02115 [Paenibacillus lentus]
MKQVLLGSTLCLSGVVLYGMSLIAASIYTKYGAIHTKDFGNQMLGSFPIVLSIILFIAGIVISTIGLRKDS